MPAFFFHSPPFPGIFPEKGRREVPHHLAPVPRHIPGVRVLEHLHAAGTGLFGIEHGRHHGPPSAGLAGPLLELARKPPVIPFLHEFDDHPVEPFRLLVGVEVRKVGASHDEHVFPFCRPEDGLGNGLAGPQVLRPHHDGDKGKRPEHHLQKGQLDLDGVLRRVELPVGIQDGVRPEDRACQLAVDGDDAKRRFISPRGPDRGASKKDPVARPDDDHGVIAPAFNEPIAGSGDLPRVRIAGMGADEAHDRPPDGLHGNLLEITADIASEG